MRYKTLFKGYTMSSIIPTSHMALVRARRNMEKSFQQNDWSAIKDWDLFLSTQLNQAFDDPKRDHNLLAKELSTILALYSDLTRAMPEQIDQDSANA